MATLLVFRGDSLEREIELGIRPIRIGRNANNNEVVLTDPTKAVSRSHAELRYEGGVYVLNDLGSQNGLVLDGNRVDRAVLYPNVAVMIGPFRLVVDQTSRRLASDDGTLQGGTPPYTPRSDAGYDADYDDQRIVDEEEPASARRGYTEAPRRSWIQRNALPLIVAGAVATAGTAVVLNKYLRQPAKKTDTLTVEQHIIEAKALLDGDEPQRALTEHIDPGLEAEPENEELIDLKSTAEAMIKSINLSPTRDASGGSSDQTFPPPRPPRLPEPAKPPGAGTMDSGGGAVLPPRPGPVPAMPDEAARIQKQYEDSVAALARSDYARAQQGFLEVSRSASPLAGPAKDKLAEVQRRRREDAMTVYQQAQQLENDDQWQTAIEAFQRAQKIDEGLSVTAEIARVNDKRLKAAEAKFTNAERLYKRKEDAQALQLYVEVLALLTPGDARYATVQQRIAELRK